MGAVVGNSPAANVCPPDGVMAPATIAALAKKAVAVVGNGLTTAIAAAVGAKNIVYWRGNCRAFCRSAG